MFKRFITIGILLLFWLLFISVLNAQERVNGQMIVQLKLGSEVSTLVKSVNEKIPMAELHPVHQLSKSWNTWLLGFHDASTKNILELVKKEAEVEIAQFNHRLSKRSIPNDTSFNELWSLQNTGQRGGIPDADIDAPEAWDLTTGGLTVMGDTIVIAIIDEGCDLNHQDLKFWKNYAEVPNNGIDDDQNGYIDDFHGWNSNSHTDNTPSDFHGTHVAGIAGAIGNNTTGITGVAWDVQLMPLSLVNYIESEVVEDYGYIFEMRKLYNISGGAEGAFIVATNSSFGIDFGKPEDYPLWTAMYDSMGSVGILSAGATVNSAANIDSTGDIPTSCPSNHLITVTNTTRHDNLSPGAGFGYTTVDIGAPGTGIYSTTPGNNYSFQSGTSMSTPHVAGAVALMFAYACEDFMKTYHAKPDSMALVVKDYLLLGVDALAGLQGKSVSGGRLNINNSLRLFYNDVCVNCVQFDLTASDVPCHGHSNGNVSVALQQGIPPFSYLWSNGETAPSINSIAAGTYFVTITDSSGCEKIGYTEVTEPTEIIPVLSSIAANEGNNGIAVVHPQGGMPPYSFMWNVNNSINDTLINIAPGKYFVTVTDANGCTVTDSIIVEGANGINSYREKLSDLKIFPNPANGLLNISFSNYESGNIQLTMTNLLGQVVLVKNIGLMNGKTEFNIDISSLAKGAYTFLVNKNGELTAKKKIIIF